MVTLRWLPEWNRQILSVAQKYRHNKFVRWQEAEADGALCGLPAMFNHKDLSHRLNALKRVRRPQQGGFRGLDTHGKYRRILALTGAQRVSRWSLEMDLLLCTLATDPAVPRRGVYIDWRAVLWHPCARALCRYGVRDVQNRYSMLKRHRQRCRDSLEWNRANRKRYCKNQDVGRRRLIKGVHEVLYPLVILR